MVHHDAVRHNPEDVTAVTELVCAVEKVPSYVYYFTAELVLTSVYSLERSPFYRNLHLQAQLRQFDLLFNQIEQSDPEKGKSSRVDVFKHGLVS